MSRISDGKHKDGVGENREIKPNCPSCKLKPIIFDEEKLGEARCQFCGSLMEGFDTQRR